MKKINVYKLIITAACLGAMNGCIAADVQNQSSSESSIEPKLVKLPNQGFVKNPSEELKKTIPYVRRFFKCGVVR